MIKPIPPLTFMALGLILSSATLLAQESREKKYAFNSDHVKLSNFYIEVAPGTNFANLNGQLATIGMFSAGFILNDNFSISYFMANSPKLNLMSVPEFGSDEYVEWVDAGVELDRLPSSTEFVYVNFRHSGLRFDYLHRTDRILFWRAGFSAGFLGGLTLSENKNFLGLFNNTIYDEPVVSLSPEIGLGVNLLKWWRVHTDLGYRILMADQRIMDAADSDSFVFSLSFSFGNFGK